LLLDPTIRGKTKIFQNIIKKLLQFVFWYDTISTNKGGEHMIERNQRLREFRISKGLSQSEMAAKLGISRVYWIKLEHGERQASRKLLDKFMEVFPDESIIKIFFY
jgi:DNA-binding XRE family transcriptional regulator